MIATYAYYVWPCYIVTAVVLALNVWLARRSHAKELQASRRRQQMKVEQAQ
jgi:heme exporter protein CcmD